METVRELYDQFSTWMTAAIAAFWEAATEPLKHLRVETGVLIVLAVLLGWLVARIVRSATWRFDNPVEQGLQIAPTAHTNTGMIALSLEEYIRKFADNPEVFLLNNQAKNTRQRWVNEKQRKVRDQYFVVTIVERRPDAPRWLGNPVLTKELRVWAKSVPPAEGVFQLDTECLRDVRDHNSSSADDIEGRPIEGNYDLYMRKVSIFDVRHWLVHPNREIRIAVWVTIISMIVPVVFDSLFGGA
jgi:hypothetical protein